MTSTLQIVDGDTGTLLFDLNDQTGVNSASYGAVQTYLIGDPDFGIPTLEQTDTLPAEAEVAYVSFSRFATAECSMRIRIKATSYDRMNLAVGTLAQYLSQGCTMKWVASGSSETRYIDVLPSATPALLGGQELALYKAATLFDSPEGVTLLFKRQPYLRGAGLTAASNILTNATMLRDSNGDGSPDGWTVTDYTSYQEITQTTASSSVGNSQTWTFSVYAKATGTTPQIYLAFQPLTSGGSNNGSEITSSLTTLTSTWQRVTISGTTPGSSTSKAKVIIRTAGAVGSYTLYVKNAQFERASSASSFRVNAETVSADPSYAGFAKMIPVYNPGTAPAPCVLTAKFTDANAFVSDLDYWLVSSDSIPGRHYLADFLNGPNWAKASATANGWTVTLGADTTSVSAPADSAPYDFSFNTAQTTHSGNPTTFARRITWSRTTLLDSLRGRHRVLARVKPASATIYRLRLNWGPGGLALNANQEVFLDTSDAASQGAYLVDLGEIDLPEAASIGLGTLTLELWTRMDTGKAAANLDTGTLYLVPSDQTAHAQVSTDFSSSTQTFIEGADLTTPPKKLSAPASDPTWTAGSVFGSELDLTAANQAGGVGDNTNGAYTGVSGLTKRFNFFDVNAEGSTGSVSVNFEVANITDNTIDVTTTRTASPTGAAIQLNPIISLAEVTGKKYQPRITLTSQSGTAYVSVRAFSYTETTDVSISQNQQVRADAGSVPGRLDMEKLDSSENLLVTMQASRIPFWIPPGLSLIALEPYNEEIVNYPGPRSLNTFTFTLTPTVYPRWWV